MLTTSTASMDTNPLDIALQDAKRLGHKMSSFSGPMENGKYFSYCHSCDDYLDAWPIKVWGMAQVTGPAVALRCSGQVEEPAALKAKVCKYCGNQIVGYTPRLCKAPYRMGPCE
jgi:uncharacterized CHY-type Zn-finger protein